jgi:hypothetical protein
MTTQDTSANHPAEKLIYQTPLVTELQINQLTQSATQIMKETDSGYYS